MTTVLYVYANPKELNDSFTLRLGRSFFDIYKQVNPDDAIEELDLYKLNLPLVDKNVLEGWDKLRKGETPSPEEKNSIQNILKYTDQFIQADKVVIGAPMWNLGFPPLLKIYLDTLVISNKTFKYTENGPIGLVEDKPVLHFQARGGIYSKGPAKEFEFADSYLSALMKFLGITDFKSVICEGLSLKPEEAEKIFQKAAKEAQSIAKSF
jgi:FMN-dependent NADH-azoreductase